MGRLSAATTLVLFLALGAFAAGPHDLHMKRNHHALAHHTPAHTQEESAVLDRRDAQSDVRFTFYDVGLYVCSSILRLFVLLKTRHEILL